MKKILLSIGLLFMFVAFVNGQCSTFAKSTCLPKLGNFLHDGNMSNSQLREGETAELYKTFFSGQTYRLVVCKADNLPPIHVKVVDREGKVLFDNKNSNFNLVWDFAIKSTQMLVVQLKVLDRHENSNVKETGCVGILFGIDREED